MPPRAGSYKHSVASSESSDVDDDEFYDVHHDVKYEKIDLTPTKDIVKLRRRRKLLRKRYWDRVLRIAYEHEKTKPYDDAQEAGAASDWNAIHSSQDVHEWLNRTTTALPSKMGEGPVPGKLLQGTHYRLFKRAGNLIYAKCAFIDDDEEYPDDDADHLKEAGGPDQSEYRKNFDFIHHLEKIRSFPTTLQKKKKMLRYLNSEAELFKQMKETNHRAIVQSCFHSFKSNMHGAFSDITPFFDIWETRIRTLYAFFGNEVHLCFLWFRKLLGLQFGYMLLAVLMVIIPEASKNSKEAVCRRQKATGRNCTFDLTDLLTGENSFETWYVYYGGFAGDTPDKNSSFIDKGTYRLVIFWFGIVAINATVVVSRVKRFKRFAVATDKETLFYFHEIFCSWEFSMNSIHLARIVQESIAKKLAFLNSHIKHQGTRVYYDETRYKRWGWLTKKFVSGPLGIKIYSWIVNAVVVIIAGGSSYVFWIILEWDYKSKKRVQTCFIPGLYLSLMFHIVSPWVIELTDMGLWKRKLTRNYWSLFRLTFIYGCNFAIFFVWWLIQSLKRNRCRCYETAMGVVLYCIIVWEFIFSSTIWIFKDFVLHFFLWKGTRGYVQPEPNMDSFFISCVFLQAFVAMGIQFAPMLTCLCVFIWILKFWLKNVTTVSITHLIVNARPPQVHSLKGDYDMPYFLSFYVFFVLTTFSGLHFFTAGRHSTSCGAFRKYVNLTTYKAVITTQISDGFFEYVWKIILNPAVGFAVVFIIFGAVYLVKQWGDAYQTTLDVYNGLLHLERQDRKFLLRAIYDMSSNAGGNDYSLVLDRNNIYKAKVRFLASIIIGGKRHELSQAYQKVLAKRENAVKELLSRQQQATDAKQRKRIEKQVRDEVHARDDLAASVHSIEARRASLAQKFLMHTEAIRLAHTASRKERQRKWAAEGVAPNTSQTP